MHRQPLRRELEAYVPIDAIEQAAYDRIFAFLEMEQHCFERSTLAGHFTASAFIVSADRAATVLLHHRKLLRWMQPGGHADGEADLRAVALREAQEETGMHSLRLAQSEIYDVRTFEISPYGNDPAHIHYDICYLLYADREESPTRNEESHDIAWVALDDIHTYGVSLSVQRLAKKLPHSVTSSI